jgi:hypothetical protein
LRYAKKTAHGRRDKYVGVQKNLAMNRKDFPEAMEKIFMNSNRSTRRGLSQSPSGSATIHSPLSRF